MSFHNDRDNENGLYIIEREISFSMFRYSMRTNRVILKCNDFSSETDKNFRYNFTYERMNSIEFTRYNRRKRDLALQWREKTPLENECGM